MTELELAEALRDVAAEALGDADVKIAELRRLTAGASRETWSFRALGVNGVDVPLVLRRDPPAAVRVQGIAREAQAMGCARRAGVPVPPILAVDEQAGRLEAPFILMRHVDGETLGSRIARHDRFAGVRPGLASQCGSILAQLHRVKGEDVPLLPAADPLDEIQATLEQFEPSPPFQLALRWLEENRPPAETPALVHGDFRNGNLIVDERDGVRAVLDWELAHVGDPVEDLGWLCVRAWRFGGAKPVGGFGERSDLLKGYERAGGIPVQRPALSWWEVLGTIRWGTFCLRQAGRHLAGETASVELAAVGRRVREQEYDVLRMIGDGPGR